MLGRDTHDPHATAVAIHPVTGDPVFCFTRSTDPLPERYRRLGYEKYVFRTVSELRRWCASKGLVNDITEYDSGYEGFDDEVRKAAEQKEQQWLESYKRERQLAAKALGVGPHGIRL
jgi:hypothetical protein